MTNAADNFGSAAEFDEDQSAEVVVLPTSLLGEWDAGADSDAIPPRAWLLGNIFCRQFISSLLGGGASGKTALRFAQYLSLATGIPLVGDHVFVRSRVLVVSLEDPRNEVRRRIAAAKKHHPINPDTLTGWLWVSRPS